MQIGLIGLEKMGFHLALTLKDKGYDVVAFDLHEPWLKHLAQQGIKTVTSVKDLAESVDSKRIIWLMLPAGELVDVMLDSLTPYLSVGDIVIDGGDSDYRDSTRRAKTLEAFQVNFLDCGFSKSNGGPGHGISATIGGNRFAFNHCASLFNAIVAPGRYLHCGASGSGHFVNMIYEVVKHDITRALTEGVEVLQKSEFKLDLEKIANVWSRSLAQDNIMRNALRKHPER